MEGLLLTGPTPSSKKKNCNTIDMLFDQKSPIHREPGFSEGDIQMEPPWT